MCERQFPVVGQRRAARILRPALGVNRETVIVAGDLHRARSHVLDGLIHSPMAELHLVRAASQCQSQQLVAKADPEDGNRAQEFSNRRNTVCGGAWITWAIGKEYPVEAAAGHDSGRRLSGKHRALHPVSTEQTKDVSLHPEVIGSHPEDAPVLGGGGSVDRCGFYRSIHAHALRKVRAHHPVRGPDPADQRLGVQVDRADPRAHSPPFPQEQGQPAGIDPFDANHRVCCQLVLERAGGAPRRGPPTGLADREPSDLDLRGFGIARVHAVVTLVRGGHGDDLPSVGRIGQHFLVSGHARIEDRFTEGLTFGAERRPREDRAVLERKQRRRSPHLVALPWATVSAPRRMV